MLTQRKITVPVGDTARAARRARYILDTAESPEAFARGLGNGRPAPDGKRVGSTALWLGTTGALGPLGLERGRPIEARDLAIALQGRHTETGEQIRRPGPVTRVRRSSRGAMVKDTVRGVASLDLTFSAPKSVSVIWSQADPELRLLIERAMLDSADSVLEYMTQTKPIVMMGRNRARQKLYGPARGFAAAAALHVTARRARGEPVPAPQLHVHGVLVGAERPGGGLSGMESSALFKPGVPREGGAAGRVALAGRLVGLGFEIQAGTGKDRRFFEVRGVPVGLIEAMSARARDVTAEIERIEGARGKPMGGRERAVVALKTREPKLTTLSAKETVAAWDSLAQGFAFGPAAVQALRAGRGSERQRKTRPEDIRRAIGRRTPELGSPLTSESARAIAFECAAGQLGVAEVLDLIEEMGHLDRVEDPAPRRRRGTNGGARASRTRHARR